MGATRIAVVMSGFPRLSETFALPELRALDERGMLAGLYATKPGDASAAQPDARPWLERVEVAPNVSTARQAAWLAERAKAARAGAMHGYFAHTPAELAQRASEALGLPFSFSAHAKDVRKVVPAQLLARVRAARVVVACNSGVAADLAACGVDARLLSHGVDLARFAATDEGGGCGGSGIFRLLAVGRLVEKKGFDVLLRALARLSQRFALRIVGDGPERSALEALAGVLGVSGRVAFIGSLTHAELPREYAAAHAVVAPSRTDSAGDRDGLPNVVLEAMAAGRAIVACEAGAIASALVDGSNGLLVQAEDAAALASALARLADAPSLARALGAAARSTVEARFDVRVCAARFASALEAAHA